MTPSGLRLRLRLAALRPVELGEIVQGWAQLCMIGTAGLFHDSDVALVERLGLTILAPRLVKPRQFVEGPLVGLTKLIRAPAIEGVRLPDCQIAALLRSPAKGIDETPRSHLALTRPAVGCFLSHLAVWRWALATNLPRVLVFEDDAVPAGQFSTSRFRSVVASLPEDTGLVFVGRIIMGGLADRAEGSDLARIYYFNGTFAYLITPAACRSLMQHLLPLNRHIDHQISKVLIEQRHTFPAYYTEPHLFEPDWSLRSDCYVPLAEETHADRELAEILESCRCLLLGEARPLLPQIA